ncbi:tetratricopeptide repeat-containing sensor histidine kinase [Aquimarina celericrescens]|uniref:Histidine kinase n=1 Tax=Aquimarina celericrescens TaxID=1964542 RepID=A0ABW5B305_9FLAO
MSSKDSLLFTSRKRIDSLSLLLKTEKPKIFLKYSKESLLLSRLLKDTVSFANKYQDIARHYSINNQLILALKNIDSSVKYYRQLKDTSALIGAFAHKATFYRNVGNLDASLKIYNDALELVSEIDSTNVSHEHFFLFNNLGIFYKITKKIRQSRQFYNKALEVCELLNNFNAGLTVKLNLGALSSQERNYNLALAYYKEVLRGADSLQIKLLAGITKGNIGFAYYNLGDYELSLKYTKEGLNLLEKSKSELAYRPVYKTNLLHTLGVSNMELGNFEDAQKYLKEGIRIANKFGIQSSSIVCNEAMYQLKLKEKDFKTALFYFQQHIRARDSLFSVETINKINKIESEKQLSEKQQELTDLSIEKKKSEERIRNKYIQYIILSAVLIVVLTISLLWYNQRNRTVIAVKNQKLLENELHALRSQMDPHFIFNTLNSVQNFILKSEKFEAYNYLIKFSDAIRLILENSKDSFIELKNELELIDLYVDLQKLRFRDKIEYIKEIDPKLLEETIQIPAMIIQPIVENAILHGIVNKKEKGTVKLSLHYICNGIKCVVEDNGVGRKEAIRNKQGKTNRHLSISSINTSERIRILKKNGYKKVTYHIEDLFSKKGVSLGTRVSIILPILKPNDTET